MGHATCGVVGAALARRGKAVALVGDGAMLMMNELSTAAAYGVNAVWIVLNDARYNMIEQGMRSIGELVATLGVIVVAPCFHANVREAAREPAASLRRLPVASVEYTGVAAHEPAGGRAMSAHASLVAPHLERLAPYRAGKPVKQLERELGIRAAIKLASNENPFGPSACALAAAARALAEGHRYPDGQELRAALALDHGVSPPELVLGNGSNATPSPKIVICRCIVTGSSRLGRGRLVVRQRRSLLARARYERGATLDAPGGRRT